MSKNLGLAGWVVAGLLGALLYSEWVANGISFHHLKAFFEHNRESKWGGLRSNGRPGADGQASKAAKDYQPDCSKREDADLCAQRRIAVAAEEQAGLSALGVWLLLFTFIATTAAALYARSAALGIRRGNGSDTT